MNSSLQSQKPAPWISEGLIIATAPVVAYLYAFLYQGSFAAFFGIPLEFVTISLTTVCIVAVLLVCSFQMFFFTAYFVYLNLKDFRMQPEIRFRLASPSYAAIPTAIGVYYFRSNWRLWIGGLVTFLVIAGVHFGLPLITNRGKKTYIEKLRGQDEVDNAADSPMMRAVQRLGPHTTTAIILFLYGALISFGAGYSDASKQKEFLMLRVEPELVVLRIYGDNLICAPLDRQTGRLERSLVIQKLGENSRIHMRWEKVGPLELRKETR